jgi:hypothetical protein
VKDLFGDKYLIQNGKVSHFIFHSQLKVKNICLMKISRKNMLIVLEEPQTPYAN